MTRFAALFVSVVALALAGVATAAAADGSYGPWEPTYELWTIRRDPSLPEFPSVVSRYEKDRPKWSRTEPE